MIELEDVLRDAWSGDEDRGQLQTGHVHCWGRRVRVPPILVHSERSSRHPLK